MKRYQRNRLTLKSRLTGEESEREIAAAIVNAFFPPMPVLLMLHVLFFADFAASIICPTFS